MLEILATLVMLMICYHTIKNDWIVERRQTLSLCLPTCVVCELYAFYLGSAQCESTIVQSLYLNFNYPKMFLPIVPAIVDTSL